MKRGISLIVLVITIIVMIILAATVVITLSNTGVINRASQAVDLTNEASVQDLAALIWADAYMDNKRDEALVTEVTTKLEEQGITDAKWNITVDNTGIVVEARSLVTKEYITFTFLRVEYTVEKGTTWSDFVFDGAGRELDFTVHMEGETEKLTSGSINWGTSGARVFLNSPFDEVDYGDEILAAVYITSNPGQ
jgi:hypothetical protein